MQNEYDPYLGLTNEEKSKVVPLNESGQLSHKIFIDKDNKQIVTIGVHMITGDEYVQRRRPMSLTELKPFPEGYM